MGRLGWYVESTLSPRLHRANQYVTVSLPSARDLTDLGVDPGHIAVVRNGLDEAPPQTLTLPRSGAPRVAVLSRLVPHKQIEDALDAVAELRPRMPDLHLDILGGGWWRQRLVDHAALLGISDAVTFHGHVDDLPNIKCCNGAGCMCCRRAKRAGAWPSPRPRSIRCPPSATGPPAG